METEYRYLLHLLGAYIRGEAPEASETADWQKLTSLAAIHGVTGILGYMTMKHPICPDAQLRASLRSICRGTAAKFLQRGESARQLSEALAVAGIDHILMKGYVLRGLYPVPELRTFNDIDIVIRPADRQRSDERMMTLGFQRHADWEPVYSYFRGQELYELHTELLDLDVSDRADYRGYFRDLWAHARPLGAHTYAFTPEFHFLYLLNHIAKHVHGSGAGARMYLDAAAFLLHHADMDWAWLSAQLRQLQLETFAGVVLAAAEDWFSVACPMEFARPEAAVMADFLDFTLEAGVFGHHDRDGALTALKHEEENASRLGTVLRESFPGVDSLKSRYTYLQTKPWLLPAAWVHRLVKNREKLGRRTKQMQDILRAEDAKVAQLRKLMTDIGL